jgi:hypothetical protein
MGIERHFMKKITQNYLFRPLQWIAAIGLSYAFVEALAPSKKDPALIIKAPDSKNIDSKKILSSSVTIPAESMESAYRLIKHLQLFRQDLKARKMSIAQEEIRHNEPFVRVLTDKKKSSGRR